MNCLASIVNHSMVRFISFLQGSVTNGIGPSSQRCRCRRPENAYACVYLCFDVLSVDTDCISPCQLRLRRVVCGASVGLFGSSRGGPRPCLPLSPPFESFLVWCVRWATSFDHQSIYSALPPYSSSTYHHRPSATEPEPGPLNQLQRQYLKRTTVTSINIFFAHPYCLCRFSQPQPQPGKPHLVATRGPNAFLHPWTRQT